MSMTRNKIEAGITEARRFIVASQAALERIDAERTGSGRQPTDHSWGSKETGALRRASLDLTRTLAELRK